MTRVFVIEINSEWVELETARQRVIKVPAICIPSSACIGDFIYEITETGQFMIDTDITAERKRQIRIFCESLFD